MGLEGSARFAAMAREYSGCEVLEQDFLELDLPAARFDGVFANAALFHVPGRELPRVLGELHATLKPGGVLFSSNPRGANEEGWNRGRYGAYHDLETWRRYLTAAGLRRARPLLPPARPAARAAALAGERLASAIMAHGKAKAQARPSQGESEGKDPKPRIAPIWAPPSRRRARADHAVRAPYRAQVQARAEHLSGVLPVDGGPPRGVLVARSGTGAA